MENYTFSANFHRFKTGIDTPKLTLCYRSIFLESNLPPKGRNLGCLTNQKHKKYAFTSFSNDL